MQVLWSRAAQTRSSCHCRSCLNTATTVARRTTTTLGRRGLRAGDLFTACYSTILATAAVADAGIKESRRKEWDRLIAEVKGASNGDKSFEPSQNTMKAGCQEAKGSPEKEAQSSTLALNSAPSEWDGMSFVSSKDSHSTRTPFASQLDIQLKQSLETKIQAEKSNTTSVMPEEIVQDWLDADDTDCVLPERTYKSTIHIDKAAQMVANLVSRLLITSETPLRLNTKDHVNSTTQVMLDRFAQLHSEYPRLPEYLHRTERDLQQDRDRLHRSLITIFTSAEQSKSPVELAIGKICYNLLICTAVPNVTTYNILLRGFTLLGKYELGDLVVASLFDESKFRPNPATARLMLEHYTLKRDRIGFRTIVRRMRGLDGGMMVSRRLLYLLHRPDVQQWLVGRRLERQGVHLVERFPRNDRVFDALVKGYLRFKSPAPATMSSRVASMSGHKLNPETFVEMADMYVRRGIVLQGWSLLRILLRDFETDVASKIVDYVPEVRRAICRILALCGIDFLSYLRLEGPLRNLGGFALNEFHRGLLESMLDHIRTKILEDRLEDVSTLISDLGHVLGLSPGSSLERNPKSCTVASLVSCESSPPFQNDLPCVNDNWGIRIEEAGRLLKKRDLFQEQEALIDKRLEDHAQTLLYLSKVSLKIDRIIRYKIITRNTIISIYYGRLPPHLQKKYDTLTERHGLSQKLEYLSWVYKHWLHEKFLWEGGSMIESEKKWHTREGGSTIESEKKGHMRKEGDLFFRKLFYGDRGQLIKGEKKWQMRTATGLRTPEPPTIYQKPYPSRSPNLLPLSGKTEAAPMDPLNLEPPTVYWKPYPSWSSNFLPLSGETDQNGIYQQPEHKQIIAAG